MKKKKRPLKEKSVVHKSIFKKLILIYLIIISFFIFLNNYARGQCSYNNTLETTWEAPTIVDDPVYTNCIYGGKFIRVTDFVAGEKYKISTCGDSNFDTQITIYPAGGGYPIDYNDDACDQKSEIIFVPPSDGDYDILIDQFYCDTVNNICTNLELEKIYCPPISYASLNIYPEYSSAFCPNDDITFMGGGNGRTMNLWNYGDGSPEYEHDSYQQDFVKHKYASVGNYIVSLTLTSECGSDTTLYDTIYIENDVPVFQGEFNIQQNTVCPGEEVGFVGFGWTNNFVFDFGDDSPPFEVISEAGYYYYYYAMASHAYDVAGEYVAALTLINGCGNDTTLYDTVHVRSNLPVKDIYPIISNNTSCPGDQILFNVDTYGDDGAFEWDFGDGSPTITDQSTTHSYSAVGEYIASLTYTNNCGNDTTFYHYVYIENDVPITDADFYVPSDPVCPGDLIELDGWGNANAVTWDFGDGYSVVSLPEYEEWDYTQIFYTKYAYETVGDYKVTATFTNSCGNSKTMSEVVSIVNSLPVDYADFEIIPNPACSGDAVFFNGEGATGSYVWNFGDGSATSNIEFPFHFYNETGSYQVSFTITNNCGNSKTVYDKINIENNVIPTQWDYQFSVLPFNGEVCVGDTVVFYTFPSGSSYEWDFGDGNTSTSVYDIEGFDVELTKHVYDLIGKYAVILTLTNSCGNSLEKSLYINVKEDSPVNGYFDWSNDLINPGDVVDFLAWGGTSYNWDFGDSSSVVTTSSALTTVSHIYTSAGTYPISVTISNSCGNSKTYIKNIIIGKTEIVNMVDLFTTNNHFKIYPNPNEGSFFLKTENEGKQDIQIEIINTSGQIVYSKQYNNSMNNIFRINLLKQHPGIYLIKFKNGQNISVGKLIIN